MNDLELIKRLERHIGFVYHRLNCDGNYYAFRVDGETLCQGLNKLGEGCQLMRQGMKGITETDREHIKSSINSFDDEEFLHERDWWE